jgi:LacI family transcriptional regulator
VQITVHITGEPPKSVGYNDISLARHLPTPLSSVRASLDLLAQSAVRMLVDGDRADHVVLPPTMIPRATSGRPATS